MDPGQQCIASSAVCSFDEDGYKYNEDRLWPWQDCACQQRVCAPYFWVPHGGETVTRPSDTGHDAVLAKLKAELGLTNNVSIQPKDLQKL